MPKNLTKEAASALPANASKDLKTFLDILLKNITVEDKPLVSGASMVEAARVHLELSQDRKPGQPRIHIDTRHFEGEKAGTMRTVIDVVNDDMAFLVDSVVAEITQNYKLVRVLIHPMVHISRDKNGKFKTIAEKSGKDTVVQSHIHIELQGTLAAPLIKKLKEDLGRILSDVHYATRDWKEMRGKLKEAQDMLWQAPGAKYSKDEISEYLGFLDYLYEDNFTLLGYRAYEFTEKNGKITSKTVKDSSLGLLHDDIEPVYINEAGESLSQDLQKLRRDLPPLFISKVNKRSTVHRPVPLDAVAVKQFDKKGKVVGEVLFIGLFTSVTYSRSIEDVPLLRRKAHNIMKRSGFKPGSHDYKGLKHVLEKYPRDELFQMREKDLLKTGVSIMNLQERQRITLYTRTDPFGRYISCLVYVPRDRYDTRLRKKIQAKLEEEFNGYTGDFYTNLDDSPLARVMFIVYVDQKNPPQFKREEVERKLQKAGRLWGEHLAETLLKTMDGEEEAINYAQNYGEAFPIGYTENYEPKQAIFDILKIEETYETGCVSLDFYKCKSCESKQVRLKIFNKDAPIILSEVLPVLENMGLQVVSERPFEVKPQHHDSTIWIHDFMMELAPHMSDFDIDAVKEKFEAAFTKSWYGRIEDDSLNQLVLSAEMPWQDIKILRTYVRYMRQIGYHFGTRYIEQALTNNPNITASLVSLFHAYFDPGNTSKNDKKAEKSKGDINTALEEVDSLDEDRILRSIVNLIESTLRTNFYQRSKDGEIKDWLSIKLNSSNIKEMPKPVPYREIFVYSPRIEGIHLRGDIIARGGLRWSDRHEDFRTEVLGLMKAQQVKNSVIVPMGAKGGFVVKNPPTEGGRQAFMDEGIECYKTFIRGLLDITDNRKGNKIIKPKNVVCRDGDDPYLVVAADKGTATFSDIANGLSKEYGHWLGDAFASGGSAGYDHKKMGITARGAWESVKRHFRELNHDTQAKPFDVIGVGDMGGDVFGNGLLLSKHIRMVGAFNHLHIFCDPDPDPAVTFKERQRLFKAVKGWDEYDTSKLSKGGKIFNRSDKSLTLTPEIKKRFDIDSDKVSPLELIKAMLKARTDLLWFGGIGTYIKAKDETNADVGDKSNDPLRVNATEVRARVIGEGANLAITQAARIEFSAKGGKINADFIDNSGGVDSSDHEVNIKILLDGVMADKNQKMDLPQRNSLLEDMTEEIADLVLRNNYQQAQAISLMELQAAEQLDHHTSFIRDLEKKHGIDRAIEGLPDEEEIDKRAKMRKGMTRPELSVLQAYAKILFSKDLVGSDLPDQEIMQDYWLVDYFPVPLRKKYRGEILKHRLSREIMATTMSSSLVNRMGPTFVKELMDKTGANCASVARAYLVVRDAFSIRDCWNAIEALDNKVPAQVQLSAMKRIAEMMERETVWFLTRLGRKPDMDKDIQDFGKGIQVLYKDIEKTVPQNLASKIKQRTESGIQDGLPKALARQVALIPTMGAAFDIIRISMDSKTDLLTTARIYFELGEYFHMDWLRSQTKYMNVEDHWSKEALEGIVDSLHNCQAGLTRNIINLMGARLKKNGNDGSKIVEEWIENHAPHAEQAKPILKEIRQSGQLDLSMLILAEQKLRTLYVE